MTKTEPAKQPDMHKGYGCTCGVCTKWRLEIYNAGKWPRPRYYNGEIYSRKPAIKADNR